MRKDILRALILSAVIVFSMVAAWTQGLKATCGNDVRIKDIQTVRHLEFPHTEVAGTTVCGTNIGAREQVDAVQRQAVVAATAQWNALYQ